MTEHDYASLTRFIHHQVRLLKQPIKMEGSLERLLKQEDMSRREFRQTLQQINARISKYYQSIYSKQAIAQATDQIEQLREQQLEQQRAALREVQDIDLPVTLDSDLKLYVLQDLIAQVKQLPQVDDEAYEEYELKRTEMMEKVAKIEELKEKIVKVKKYQELLNDKIGDRVSIQRNLPVAGRDELRDQTTRLRIILEKLNGVRGTKKEKLKELLSEGVSGV